MFESVLFPAPFSPRSACTSPSAASKSTPSLATAPGNRLVIPRSETAGIDEDGFRGSRRRERRRRLAGCAPLHALDEPVHRVELGHAQLLALRHDELALLVVERAGELVERAALERLRLRRDRGLRLRADGRPERR